MKVMSLVRPFPVLLTPFTYDSQRAERVPNDKEYTQEMLMEYYWRNSLMKIIPLEKDFFSLKSSFWVPDSQKCHSCPRWRVQTSCRVFKEWASRCRWWLLVFATQQSCNAFCGSRAPSSIPKWIHCPFWGKRQTFPWGSLALPSVSQKENHCQYGCWW